MRKILIVFALGAFLAGMFSPYVASAGETRKCTWGQIKAGTCRKVKNQ